MRPESGCVRAVPEIVASGPRRVYNEGVDPPKRRVFRDIMANSNSPDRIISLLQSWLQRHLNADAMRWLDDAATKAALGDPRAFFIAFSQVPRRAGKADLELDAADLASA